MKKQLLNPDDLPEEIKLAFSFYMEAVELDLQDPFRPGYGRERTLAQFRYNSFAQLCESFGLTPLDIAIRLKSQLP
jgi:hypothetical protein